MARTDVRVVAGLLLLSLAACADRAPSDTGFVGRWQRGGAGVARSELSIWLAEDGSGYRFAVNRWGPQGEHQLRCGPEGPCVEFAGEVAYYEYRCVATEDGGAAAQLLVECRGAPLDARSDPVQYVERYRLLDGGLELETTRIEQNQVLVERPGPGRRYSKLSDAPF